MGKEANVTAVVPSVDWHDAAVQTIDVTDLLVEHFKPTDSTCKVIAELRKQPPIDLVEAVQMKDW